MVKELVIHLGDCKTGSTAIQTCLMGKGYELPEGSIHYPARFNHIPLAHSLSDQKMMAADREQMEDRFLQVAAALDDSDADWGIISAEVFEFISPWRLREALARFMPQYEGRTRLISYVRPHHSKVLSAFAEQLKKTGGPKNMGILFDRRVANGSLLYHKRFSQWRDAFGPAFTLRPFIRDQLVAGDVVADFFAFVTGNDTVRTHTPEHSNSSLSLRNLMMLKAVHARMAEHPELDEALLKRVQDDLGWHIAPYLAANEPARPARLQMHRGLAQKIRKECGEDARLLDADFFEGTPMTEELDQAPAKALEKPQSLRPADYFDPAELGMIRGWADFMANIIAMEPEHFFWAVRRDAEEKVSALASQIGVATSD